MNIWIDFINAPQVSFAVPFIKELEKKGHTFILTCRDSSNTIDLLRVKGYSYTVINGYRGKSGLLKSLNFPLRVIQLIIFIKKKKIDIAFGQSSFYLPVTSFFLAVPSLYTNDNEHALGNIIGFLFAKKIVLPSPLKEFKLTRLPFFKKKTSFYPGIKEAIYLSQDVSLRCEKNRIAFTT